MCVFRDITVPPKVIYLERNFKLHDCSVIMTVFFILLLFIPKINQEFVTS